MPARRKRRKAKSPSVPKPEFGPGGDVRTNFVKGAGLRTPIIPGLAVLPRAVPVPTVTIKSPEGKLELRHEYKLKGGLFAIVQSRQAGSDPGRTPMVVWRKGHMMDDHHVKWAPDVQAVERYVEDFIFSNLEET